MSSLMENDMKKRTLWAGVVDSQITFFGKNPEGNVEGLQGSRKFHVESDDNGLKLTDDNGTNVIENTSSGGGANTSDISEQEQPLEEHQVSGQQPPATA